MKPKVKANKDVGKTRDFFLALWNKRRHVSEVSGEKLYSPPSSSYFHHILLKSKHPEAMYDEENIILLTTEEHDLVHKNMYRYEEVNRRRDCLLKKYDMNDRRE